jgi:hypothetical protein
MPWQGSWGPLSDHRSKISRLVRRIEEELVEEHRPNTPRQRRLLRRAAILEALAVQTADTLGVDPKATKRSLTALERAADAKIAQVKASSNGQREPEFDPAADLAKQRIES